MIASPGDIIRWVYRATRAHVYVDALWSSSMRQWCPIHKYALLVHIDEQSYTWLSSDGRVFNALTGDAFEVDVVLCANDVHIVI